MRKILMLTTMNVILMSSSKHYRALWNGLTLSQRSYQLVSCQTCEIVPTLITLSEGAYARLHDRCEESQRDVRSLARCDDF